MVCDDGICIKGYKSLAKLAAIIVATYAGIKLVNRVSIRIY